MHNLNVSLFASKTHTSWKLIICGLQLTIHPRSANVNLKIKLEAANVLS